MIPRFLLIGDPGGRRVQLFAEALQRLGGPPAVVVPWLEVLAGRSIAPLLAPDVVTRLESPEGDPDVRRRLLALGAPGMDGQRGERIGAEQALALADDGSGLRYPRQQQLGFEQALSRLGREIGAARCMIRPIDVAGMADKADCHRRFQEAGLPVPAALPAQLRDVGDLRAAMDDAGVDRIFVKLRHGSSAAGMAAYDRRGVPELITSLRFDGEVPYSSLRLRRTEEPVEIHQALQWLLNEGAHTEAWLPKATLDGREFDLRVVVIDGRARHAVARVARDDAPMTNLHLGNDRGALGDVKARLGATWSLVRELAQGAAACFPGALYAGVDIAVVPGFGPVLLEINAFGDLLPGVLQRGEDTYQAEIRAETARRPATGPAA